MATKTKNTPTISFKTKLYTIGDWVILLLPKEASEKLPSRGQVMVEGTINGESLRTPLEPDGRWSHWFHVDDQLLRAIHAQPGDIVSLSIKATKDWPEPTIPTDLMKAIEADPVAHQLWQKITPMARWEWLRWTRSTGNTETRKHRIEVACSKMRAGERRPCCWNRNLSTEPAVSKSGFLIEPANK